uniref:Uncharacterized protein n=1 Tax=Anguilla anguilla TaxID=7936 RepID=A0A0E9T358_ANGAN
MFPHRRHSNRQVRSSDFGYLNMFGVCIFLWF